MSSTLSWNADSNAAIVQAVQEFNLRKLGWRGFESLPWVLTLKGKYPQIETIAYYTSSILGARLDEVTALFTEAAGQDRAGIRSYFVAKLALEKLSCDASGAGAGMCDKFAAYLQIFELSKQMV